MDNRAKGAEMTSKKLSIRSFRPTIYQNFFNLVNIVLAIAAAVTGLTSLRFRNIWRK